MKEKALYPGSFDPLTYGHMDLVDRALHIFGEVHVAIASNQEKTPLFSTEDRLEMVKKALRGKRGISVRVFDGLIVDYARKNGIKTIIRGLRATSDFDYEFQMALTNRTLAKDIDTIFLMPSETHLYLSSRLVKEIARYGGNLQKFVPKFVGEMLRKKFEI
ncbi:MAG: pantetheine-phosphate adenylyltransferase [Candidatus Omnitrophica bacterium]|nr:pantetheine-phosphate adenylyltransferase [Candidatus Omnitrophota bacterium]